MQEVRRSKLCLVARVYVEAQMDFLFEGGALVVTTEIAATLTAELVSIDMVMGCDCTYTILQFSARDPTHLCVALGSSRFSRMEIFWMY